MLSVLTTKDINKNQEAKDVASLTQRFENAIADDTFVDENANLLIDSSHAPIIIEYIAILTNGITDPSLISMERPKESFKLLDTPDSFKSCISQIVRITNSAYTEADSAMYNIQCLLKDIPDKFITVLKFLSQSHIDKSSQRTLKRLLDTIEKCAESCLELSKNVHQKFSGVIDVIDELLQAVVDSSTFSEREKEKLSKMKKQLEDDQKIFENLTKESKERSVEAEKIEIQARKNNQKQLQGDDVLKKLIIIEGIGCVKDVVKSVISPEHEAVSLGKDVLKIGFEKFMEHVNSKDSANDSLLLAKQKNLAHTLESIVNTLDASTKHATINDYISSLKSFETVTFGTSEGIALLTNAKRCRQFLEQNSETLDDDGIKKQLENMKTSVLNDVTTSLKSMEERRAQKSREKTAQISLREQIVVSDNDKTRITAEQYNKASEIAERRRIELNEKAEKLRLIIRECQTVDLRTDDLTGYIKCLKNALKYISNTKGCWQDLVKFFDRIKIVIERNLNENIRDFTEEAKIDNEKVCAREFMINSAIEAIRYSIQITNCSKLYCLTSQKHIMPVVNGIHTYFDLTPSEVQQKQSEFEIRREEIERNVRTLVEATKEKYEENVEKQTKELATKINAAIMPFTTRQQISN